MLDALELEASDRRSRATLIGALAGAPLADLLRALRVPELREFCTTLGLFPKGPMVLAILRGASEEAARDERRRRRSKRRA